ncbi:hypothetical protein BIX54_00865 [Mycoplasmoides pneumoniae]|nr:hypothetical protein BIX54_00865 [Mycoplasmoides pneumoniae]
MLASCGAKGRFDQVDDCKIKLASSLTGKRDVILQEVLNKYNSRKAKDDYPIEITKIAGSYDGGRSDLQTRLSVKDKTTFYNMILNYSDTISTLGRSNMELPLDSVDVSQFSENFLSFNDRISGISRKGIYGIPVSMSTDILVINGPVLHYILNSAKKKDGAVTKKNASNSNGNEGTLTVNNDQQTTELWKKIEEAAKTNGKTTQEQTKRDAKQSTSLIQLKEGSANTTEGNASENDKEIKKSWGNYQEVDGGLKGYTFKASVFEN